jgi:hypothetical protein
LGKRKLLILHEPFYLRGRLPGKTGESDDNERNKKRKRAFQQREGEGRRSFYAKGSSISASILLRHEGETVSDQMKRVGIVKKMR